MSATAHTSWWRRKRLWLLATLPLAAWAFIVPYRAAQDSASRVVPDRPITVAKGQWKRYEGARWRLVDRRILKPPGGVNPFHADANVVSTVFEVVLDPGSDPSGFAGCKTQLSDARGRTWSLMYEQISLPPDMTLPTQCTSGLSANFKTIRAQPGQPFRFRNFYLVPREVPIEALRPEVVLARPRAAGSLLRFEG